VIALAQNPRSFLMSHDDPFTIDLFGNTALSSGLGLGVTAFADSYAGELDDETNPPPSSPAAVAPVSAAVRPSLSPRQSRSSNFYLAEDRNLAHGWKERSRDNIAAIRLSAEIEVDERPATRAEQEKLIRFTGFGASDLANGVFRRPGEVEFRQGWEEIGLALEDAVGEMDYASLARCTQ
jgi:adenine-specific DNA methylase